MVCVRYNRVTNNLAIYEMADDYSGTNKVYCVMRRIKDWNWDELSQHDNEKDAFVALYNEIDKEKKNKKAIKETLPDRELIRKIMYLDIELSAQRIKGVDEPIEENKNVTHSEGFEKAIDDILKHWNDY